MSFREQILNKIRQAVPTGTDLSLPDLSQIHWTTYPDPVARFSEVLQSVGGQCEIVQNVAEVEQRLSANPFYSSAKSVVSCMPGVGRCDVDWSTLARPHDLADVDFAILPGEIAVAENSAVWVTGVNVPERVLYFLSQHLALVVSIANLVSNMHEAYSRISVGATPFGAWVAGPSKTADIEQSLVIGAHGARSMTVFLVEQL